MGGRLDTSHEKSWHILQSLCSIYSFFTSLNIERLCQKLKGALNVLVYRTGPVDWDTGLGLCL